MPITTECPHCGKGLRVADTAAGKNVRCPKCQESFRVSAPQTEDDEDDVVEVKPSKVAGKRKSAARDAPKPRQKRSRKQEGSGVALVLGLAMGGGVLVLLLVAVGGWLLFRDKGTTTSNTPNQPFAQSPPGGPFVPNAFGPPGGQVPPGGVVPQGDGMPPPGWDPVTGRMAPKIPPGTPELTGEQLAAEYAANPEAAEKKYHDKTVIVTGTVVSKTSNQLGATCLMLKGNGKYQVGCGFTADEGDQAQARPVQSGQQIKVLGSFLSSSAGSDGKVYLAICNIIK